MDIKMENNSSLDTAKLDQDSQKKLMQLLTSWGLEVLYHECASNLVDIEALRYMTPEFRDDFISKWKIGLKIKFVKKLSDWQSNENYEIPTPVIENHVTMPMDVSVCNESRILPEVVPVEQTTTAPSTLPIDVQTLLNDSAQGRTVIKYYEENKTLNDNCRTVIVELIINHLIQNSIKMSVDLAKDISKKIVELFSTEIISLYYFREPGKAPMGKVYAKYFNQMRVLQGIGYKKKKHMVKKTKSNASPIVPETRINSNLEALQSGSCSWSETENHWQMTTNYRVDNLTKLESTSDMLSKWQQYKSAQGYKLIEIDFKTLHPNADGALNMYEQFASKIINSFDIRIKDMGAKVVLDALKNEQALSDNGKAASIFYLLHYVLVPRAREIKHRHNKRICIKYTIKDSINSFMLVGATIEEVEEQYIELFEDKKTMQPMILIAGSLKYPQQVVVCFDGIRYYLDSVIYAIDVCFKIYNLFNLKYPIASTMVWNFIQKFFYKITTEDDKNHPNIELLISELESN